MRIYRFLSLFVVLALLSSCGGKPNGDSPLVTPSLPPPVVHVTSAPDPQATIRTFLDTWKANDFAGMYALISKNSQNTISQEDFIKSYGDATNKMTLKELQYELLSHSTNSTSDAQVTFRVTYKTALFGDFQREMSAGLKLEDGQWKIAWEDGLILPELRGGNHLAMDPDVPTRGILYDRNGKPLVAQTDVTALGINPSQLLPETESILLGELSRLTGLYPGTIAALYENSRGTDWYTPVGEAPADEVNRRYSFLSSLGGLVMSEYKSRFYYQDGLAPQAVGYVSLIQKDELDQYMRQGYSQAALIGRIGIEKWGEQYLAGKTGGSLYVAGKDGTVITNLGKSNPTAASAIHLTLDNDLQYQAQKAIEGFRGSIVVLERDTGRVLAIASSPKFDPNLFDPNNNNSASGVANVYNDPNQPMYNRASKGLYPLGSVFKVITFSAALESSTYTPETKYDCQYHFTELADRVLDDWTWEHFQAEFRATGEGKTRPSGMLTLTQGLMRSCNPYFWHIGRDLFLQGRVSAIADMARGFGLSKLTGIDQIEEDAGTIVNPTNELEATNQAIGQGDVLVTPLQVADFMAAIGNGGTLYRPQLVEKIVDPAGNETILFKPESRGVLPMKPESLAALRVAMREVITNPVGTAHNRFYNFKIPVYGKTGTAESNIPGSPHAWFAGYTDANLPGTPDIAIAVIAENAGEGSQIAAPIFKRVVESYFVGNPQSPYWWESSIGITRTPTEPVTPTPKE